MRSRILEVGFDNLTMEQAKQRFLELLQTDQPSTIATPNPEMVMLARKDEGFKEVLNAADLVVPDGIGIVHASKLTKNPLKQRVAGFDLLMAVFDTDEAKHYKWYFLGGKPGVAEKAKNRMEQQFGLKIVGCGDGYFDDDDAVINRIAASEADVVLVGLGFPRQEIWANTNKYSLGAKLIMGVGGSFDVMSGELRRAPRIFQKIGLEWLYRLLRQPKRLWRQRVLLKFAIIVIIKKIRGAL
ncbi:MAG: WecB/TagA/CpsF family glycosyltransferase [Defluviitaleaceae bacterium]|nr:WecB/TagA/CpsF family glycosyltransferase [Defluviitaleaceae bacterium]